MNPIHKAESFQRLASSQKRIGEALSRTNLFPLDATCIISEYATCDHRLGKKNIVWNSDGSLIRSSWNEAVLTSYKEILIAPGGDPVMKRRVLQHMCDIHNGYDGSEQSGQILRNKHKVFHALLANIHSCGYRLYFDYVDFSGLKLSGYDLRGMSATHAKFVSDPDDTAHPFFNLQAVGADLRFAIFYRVNLTRAVFSSAILNNTIFYRCNCSEINLNQARAFEVKVDSPQFIGSAAAGIESDGSYLKDVDLFDHPRIQTFIPNYGELRLKDAPRSFRMLARVPRINRVAPPTDANEAGLQSSGKKIPRYRGTFS